MVTLMDAFVIAGFVLGLIGAVISTIMLILDTVRFFRERRGPKINFNILDFNVIDDDNEACKIEIEYRFHNVGDRTTHVDYIMQVVAIDQSDTDENGLGMIQDSGFSPEKYKLKPDQIEESTQVFPFIESEYWKPI